MVTNGNVNPYGFIFDARDFPYTDIVHSLEELLSYDVKKSMILILKQPSGTTLFCMNRTGNNGSIDDWMVLSFVPLNTSYLDVDPSDNS